MTGVSPSLSLQPERGAGRLTIMGSMLRRLLLISRIRFRLQFLYCSSPLNRVTKDGIFDRRNNSNHGSLSRTLRTTRQAVARYMSPKALKVIRSPLPHFNEAADDNDTDHDVHLTASSINATTAGSMPTKNSAGARHPKQLVSAIFSDIKSKTATNISQHLRDSAEQLLANNETELLRQSSEYYELLATDLLDLVFDLYDQESLAKMERDMAIRERAKAIGHEQSMAKYYGQLLLRNEVVYQEYPKSAPKQACENEATADTRDGAD